MQGGKILSRGGGVKTFLLCAGFKRKKFIRKNSSNTSTRFYAILRIF